MITSPESLRPLVHGLYLLPLALAAFLAVGCSAPERAGYSAQELDRTMVYVPEGEFRPIRD